MRVRILIIAAVTIAATLGIPGHGLAVPAIPQTLEHRASIAASARPGGAFARTITTPWRVNLVGVSFDGQDPVAEGVEIQLRHRDKASWSPWVHLHVDPDEQPDRSEMRSASQRVATLPQWVERAKHFEIRIELEDDAAPIRDVRLETYNTAGDATDPPVVVAALRTIGRWLTAVPGPAAPAEAATTRPRVISRAEWGADESLRSSGPGIASKLAMAHVHHTVNSNSYSKDKAASLVRGIYQYHTRTRGYSDIGYNFLVDRYGQIFEGRHGGIDKAVIGGHAAGFNTGSTGIALLGTFDSVAPPSATIRALQKLLAWKLDIHHVPPIGKVARVSGGSTKYPKGKTVSLNRISGHRDTSSTACPGWRTYDKLPSIRKAVAGIGTPKIYLPEVTPSSLRMAGASANAPAKVTASFSHGVRWNLSITDSDGDGVYASTGLGTSLRDEWDGRGRDGLLAPSGRYHWRLTARTTWGTATPASGSFWVDSSFRPPFYDDDDRSEEPYIDSISERGITEGCNVPQGYCPDKLITRQMMAVFLTRALDLPKSPVDYFSDDDGRSAEDYINRVRHAEIAFGCGGDSYCPDRIVTRAMMAVFLARGFGLPEGATDHFTDDDGIGAEPSINAIADAGITHGCNVPDGFCPDRQVTRGMMAVFLERAILVSEASAEES